MKEKLRKVETDYKFIWYKHHGKKVVVRSDLKGKHREHCLCFSCKKFTLDKREENCPIANTIYSLCILENLVLPVWECPFFIENEQEIKEYINIKDNE